MQVATGKSILNGIAIGPLRIYKEEEVQTAQTSNRTLSKLSTQRNYQAMNCTSVSNDKQIS